MSPLISADELRQRMPDPNLVIIDARSGNNAFERYRAEHLEGALHVNLEMDLSEIADPSKGGRHPLPDIKNFGALLGKLGIQKPSHVVVYDDKGGAFAAARFWWMLRAAGHEHVQLLNGGLDAAIRAGIPVSSQIPHPVAVPDYPVEEWKLPTVTIDDVTKASADPGYVIIDVREAYRYLGENEPIDLIAGHIPNAVNVPYTQNLNEEGFLLPPEKLAAMYQSVIENRDPEKVIIQCGSGVTACHTLLALELAGIRGTNLYVGSWGEWSRNNRPIATGK